MKLLKSADFVIPAKAGQIWQDCQISQLPKAGLEEASDRMLRVIQKNQNVALFDFVKKFRFQLPLYTSKKTIFAQAVVCIFILAFSITTNVSSSPDINSTASTVGSLKGNFQVTPSGQARYSIPIDVPPGTADLVPALSIAYDSTSSNTKNGLLGMGFSLEGLTAITRCSSNKTQNGLIHSVDFTNKDRFCLNGEQLIAIKGVYGEDGTEYRTYNDSKAKIISYGKQGNGPASFKVWTKGGQVAEYGFSADSQIKAEGKDSVAIWSLNKIQDTSGNYLEIEYFKDETKGTSYPVEIRYTGNKNANVTPYNSVKFIYEDRPDTKVTYIAGSKNTLDKRLKTIQTYQKENLVFEYKLLYEISANTKRSRITSIQKCSSGVCLSPTKFEWQTNEEGWEWAPQYIPPTAIIDNQGDGSPHGIDNGVRFIDLTGNGLLGIVQHVYWSPSNIQKGAWINNGDGWESVPQFTPPVAIVNNRGDSNPKGTDNGVRFVDLNGKGTLGMVQHVYWSPNNIQKGAWINNGFGWEDAPQYVPPIPIVNNQADSDQRGIDNGVRFADLTGDGLLGIVQHVHWNATNIQRGAWINNGSGWEENSQYIPPIEIVNNRSNSDRRGVDNGTRLIGLTGNGLWGMVQNVYWNSHNAQKSAWINNGSGWENAPQYIPPASVVNNKGDGNPKGIDNGVMFLDLTGSGLTDMVQHVNWRTNSSQNQKGAWINTGSGWIEAPQYTPPNAIIDNQSCSKQHGIDNGIRFIDFTGSGLSGIVQYAYWNKNTIQKGAWINNGSGWEENLSYIPPVPIINNQADSNQHGIDNGVIFIDLTGSGLPDVIQYVHWNQSNIQKGAWLNRAKKLPDYLVAVTDGYGAKLTIDYESLTNTKTDVYTKEHDAEYPNMDWQGPMYVVYQTSSDTAVNDSKVIINQSELNHTTTYHYTGAKFNHLGLGFLGFHKVTVTDNVTGISTTTTYSQDINAHNKGSPIATETRLANGVLISSSEDTWDLKTFGDGSVNNTYYSPYVKTSSKNSFDLTGVLFSTSTITNTIDDYGNPTKVVTTVKDATTNKEYATIIENRYHNDPKEWFIGELIETKVKKSATDKSEQSRSSKFIYDSKTSLLMETVASPNDPELALSTKYTRDVFGNILSTTISGKGIESRVTKEKYDDYGRFIIKSTNPLGQIVKQEIDPKFGVITKTTDLNGLQTFYEYDKFGRQVLQIAPDGTKTSTSYDRADSFFFSGDIQKVLKHVSHVVTIHTDNSVTQKEYYDILERKVASTTQGVDGKIIWQLACYDELGRVSKRSQPFFADDPIYYLVTQFDVLGRVTKNTLPDGNAIQTIYDGFTTTTVNQLQQKKIQETNALGELVKAIDNLDSITTYEYNVYGNMTSLKDSAGNVSRIEYDSLGRKVSINDPDKGHWKYQYDILGNLILEIDAKGQITEFKYDKLNRMIARTDSAGTSAWEYDTAQNGIGKLAKVESLNLVGKNLQEKLEAPAKALRDGLKVHTTIYDYDKLSRPTKVTIAVDAQSYIHSYSYDQNSRVDTETYPNQLCTKNIYNTLGYLVEIKDVETGKSYWQLNAEDASGRTISETRSNGLITNYTYDPKTGFLTDIDTVLEMSLSLQKSLLPTLTGVTATHQHFDEPKATNGTCSADEVCNMQESMRSAIQKERYLYDIVGNITAHQDFVNKVTENYKYDELNRIKSAGLLKESLEKETLEFAYDALGNVTYKSDVGTYTYGQNGAGPHAVTEVKGKQLGTFTYNKNGDQVKGILNGMERTITYTSYGKPSAIRTAKGGVSFYHNADREKFIRVDSTENKTVTTYYLGNYELVIINNAKGSEVIQQKAYIGSNTIHIKTEDNSDNKNNRTEIFEMLRNNLGSVTDITDENGNVTQHFSYAPFGERKQIKGVVPSHPLTHKGFTGHEEIDTAGINLIHMGGRIYDPILGRFLSADPHIQDPSNSQCLNRYSYCINNPLAFVDPDGHFFFLPFVAWAVSAVASAAGASALAAAAIGAVATVGIGLATGASLGESLLAGLTAPMFGAGAAGANFLATASYLSLYTGATTLINGGSLSDALLAAGTVFVTAAMWNVTGNLLSSFQGGGFSNWATRTLVHGAVGGGVSAMQGGSFKNGFLSCAVAEALPINSIGIEGNRMASIVCRTSAAAVVGGTVAASTGGNFASGAKSAAFAELFNDCFHETLDTIISSGDGFADSFTFGATKKLREFRGIDHGTDLNSWSYRVGEVAGTATSYALGFQGGYLGGETFAFGLAKTKYLKQFEQYSKLSVKQLGSAIKSHSIQIAKHQDF